MDGHLALKSLNGAGFISMDALDQLALKHATLGRHFDFFPIYRAEDNSLFSDTQGQRTLQDAMECGDDPVAVLMWVDGRHMALRWIGSERKHTTQTFAICRTTHPLRLRGGYTLVEISRTPAEDRPDNTDGMVEAYAVVEGGELVVGEAA